MDKVPVMISTKDIMYISDMFNWNFTLAKKCHHYLNEIKNEEIKQMIEKVYDFHKEICECLLKLLKEDENED